MTRLNSLTVCTVNCYSWKYVYFQDYTLRMLADNPDFQRIICNMTPDNEDADQLAKLPNTTVFFGDPKGLTGSEAHGAALNQVLSRVRTEHVLIADPDTAALARGWDTTCLSALHDRTVAVGTPYDSDAIHRYQGFPNVVFFFSLTEPFRQLQVDFRPQRQRIRRLKRQISKWFLGGRWLDADVGWRLPVAFRNAGYEARCFDAIRCADSPSAVVAPGARVVEYHWQGVPIVTHQGRSGPRTFDHDPISKAWLDAVCSYLSIDRDLVAQISDEAWHAGLQRSADLSILE